MSWEALGAIGEAMGGAGVVLTLLYLAIQVRQHTAEMRSQASESVAENLREWLMPMIEDPELSRIFRMGAEGWDHFAPDDKARFFHMAFVWLKTIEAAHYQFVRGRLDPEVWKGWEAVVTSYLRGPGIQGYWCQRRQGFSASFQAYVDSVPRDGIHFPRVGEITGEMMDRGERSEEGTSVVRCQVRSVPWTDEVPALGRGPAPMSRTSPV
jgi:hypothetical protein